MEGQKTPLATFRALVFDSSGALLSSIVNGGFRAECHISGLVSRRAQKANKLSNC